MDAAVNVLLYIPLILYLKKKNVYICNGGVFPPLYLMCKWLRSQIIGNKFITTKFFKMQTFFLKLSIRGTQKKGLDLANSILNLHFLFQIGSFLVFVLTTVVVQFFLFQTFFFPCIFNQTFFVFNSNFKIEDFPFQNLRPGDPGGTAGSGGPNDMKPDFICLHVANDKRGDQIGLHEARIGLVEAAIGLLGGPETLREADARSGKRAKQVPFRLQTARKEIPSGCRKPDFI